MYKNVSKHPLWMEMLEKVKDKPYGSQITYQELIEYAKGEDIRDEKRYIFEKMRKELLEQKNKALENIRDVGYRIVKPNEHSRLANREIKRAYRRVKSGASIILHVDYEQLNDSEKAQANLIASRVMSLAATLTGENKALKEITVNYKLPYVPRS
jgi:hypothetical protein